MPSKKKKKKKLKDEEKKETHAPLQSSLARCQLAPETRPRCVNCCSRRGGLLGVGAHCRGALSALRLHSPGLWRAAQNDVAGFNQNLSLRLWHGNAAAADVFVSARV